MDANTENNMQADDGGQMLTCDNASARAEEPAPSVRLSPVELRNLDLINDPALKGYQGGGRMPFCASPRDAAAVEFSASQRAKDELLAGEELSGAADAEEEPRWEEFARGPWRYMVKADGTARVLSYEGDELRVEIPESFDGAPVTSIAANAFRDCAQMRAVTLPPTVAYIAAHAFDTCTALEAVELPAGLSEIGPFAFAKSGLVSVSIPASVRRIGQKAFYSCKSLLTCAFSAGLAEIGPEAFAFSKVARVVVPSTVETIGQNAFDHTPAQKRIGQGTLVVDASNTGLYIDAQGGLYAHDVFLEYVGCERELSIRPGTHRIAPGACKRKTTLRFVEIPEGVFSIGDEAFRGCRSLVSADLPASLEIIGKRAFVDTSLVSMRLSENVRHIGESALLVQGEQQLRTARPLAALDVSPDNKRFYMESGMLCERGGGDAGLDLCLLYVGPDPVVRIPEAVNRIAPYAFCGASGIEELFVHDHMHSFGIGALSTARSIPRMCVRLATPDGSTTEEEFLIPSYSPRYRTQSHLFEAQGSETVFNFAYYDSWVSHATDLDEFAPAALRRLERPLGLSDRMRGIYEDIFSRKQAQLCHYFAQKGDIGALLLMHDAGVLDRERVEAELDSAAREGQAHVTGCLLELGRRLGWRARGLDVSL